MTRNIPYVIDQDIELRVYDCLCHNSERNSVHIGNSNSYYWQSCTRTRNFAISVRFVSVCLILYTISYDMLFVECDELVSAVLPDS
jgi:hypothetical protein